MNSGLDELINKFKGYIAGDNGFDELDFKEALIDRQDLLIQTAITEARIDELKAMPNHTSVNLYIRDRIQALTTTKGDKG